MGDLLRLQAVWVIKSVGRLTLIVTASPRRGSELLGHGEVKEAERWYRNQEWRLITESRAVAVPGKQDAVNRV